MLVGGDRQPPVGGARLPMSHEFLKNRARGDARPTTPGTVSARRRVPCCHFDQAFVRTVRLEFIADK